MKTSVLGIALISVLALTACQQATLASEAPLGVVQGTVDGKNFANVVAVATSKSASSAYEITLTSNLSTPSVFFTIAASPKTYTVAPFGVNGLAFYAYLGGTNFIAFDSGTVTITTVDVGSKQIQGVLKDVKTTDGQSSLSGSFTAIIQ